MTKRIRSAVLLTVIAVMLLGVAVSPVSAHWGTSRHIHVNLTPDNWYIIAYRPHINPATIQIWGPSGYYKTAYFAGWDYWQYPPAFPGKRENANFVFDNLNTGFYTITVTWKAGLDSGSVVAKTQSGSLYWWERADAYTFQSP
jgi:hypothetical protein